MSYFEKGRAELGNADHAIEHDDNLYHLASAEQARAVHANPDAYLPTHEGACAYGVTIGKPLSVDLEDAAESLSAQLIEAPARTPAALPRLWGQPN